MEYVRLGRSGLKVSRISLGTMNFGDKTNSKDSYKIISYAISSGINLIDTANRYGKPKGEGITESLIGNWLKSNRHHRRKIILCSKVHNPMGSHVNDRGLSAYHIKQAC